jgi:hypothetical protein
VRSEVKAVQKVFALNSTSQNWGDGQSTYTESLHALRGLNWELLKSLIGFKFQK